MAFYNKGGCPTYIVDSHLGYFSSYFSLRDSGAILIILSKTKVAITTSSTIPMRDKKSGTKSNGKNAYVSINNTPITFLCNSTSVERKNSFKKGINFQNLKMNFILLKYLNKRITPFQITRMISWSLLSTPSLNVSLVLKRYDNSSEEAGIASGSLKVKDT